MDIVKRLRRVGLPRLIVHASVLVVVLLWLLPTLGILVSSLRDKDQITVSGWWTAFSSSEQTAAVRLADAAVQKQDGNRYVISGNVFESGQGGKVAAFGVRVQEPTAFKAGEAADIGDGETLLVNTDGTYEYSKASSFEGSRGKRVYISVATPPVFTLDNYRTVLTSEGIGQSFVNSLTVAVPATVIPILIAAFAAYALSWMSFSGRNFLIAMVVGLIVPRARILPEAYRLKMPASPHLSARFDNVTIEPELLLPPETDGPLVIEGAGGLLVPLTDTLLFVDIFARWRIPLILCARTSLGTINHTLLSLEALRLRAIPVHGVVFIGDENRENQRIIADIGRVRSLGRLPRIPEMTAEALHHAFAQQFDLADFLEVPA